MSNWLAYTSAATLAAALIGAAGFAVPGLGMISAEGYSNSLVRYAPPGDAAGGQPRSYAGDLSLPGAGDHAVLKHTFVLIVEVRRVGPENGRISSGGDVGMRTEVTITRLRDV